jgi:bifunctional UDP-N-acetylglucosamine pyrophosphorylase/glucosamine-1-phosphate N-acetyltransferase
MKSARAKVLHPVLGMPVLEHVLRAMRVADPRPVAVVVGHQAEEVEQAFADRGLTFVRQEPPLGTGHALQSARAVFAGDPDRTLLVLNGDLPLLRASTVVDLLRAHASSGQAATLLTVELEDPGAYGRIVRDRDGGVAAIVEARDASPGQRQIREINAGVYVFTVPPLLAILDRLQPKNVQGEYYLTDVIELLAREGGRVGTFPAADPEEALGVNTLGELAEATRRLADRAVGSLLASGVRVEDPATTYVGLDVQVEPDAVIRPFTFLEGRTIVRARASVGPFVRLVDTEVGPDAQILDHCLLRESVVEAGASVGPFSHLRPESRVGPRAKVGNFVELKKSVLGEGSKAPHLSYVGDATVGPGVNIGAGTITCNYDGSAKHPTRIEAGAFIGSDTTLIAPVTVGEGAYIAAGSAITEDVPPHALALGRARQVNKEGWARTRRQKLEAAAAGRGKGHR